MGGLANWGAVAGAAGAAQQNIENRVERENKSLDEAREERLIKLREKYKSEATTASQEFRSAEAGEERAFRSEERGAGEEFKSGESEKDRQFEAVQLDKKLESAEGVASTKAAADVAKSGKAGYKSVRLKTIVKDERGFPSEEEVPVVFQESSGRYFEDKAGKLVPYNLRANITEGERRLLDNPGSLSVYLEKTGRPVPEWYKMMYPDHAGQ